MLVNLQPPSTTKRIQDKRSSHNVPPSLKLKLEEIQESKKETPMKEEQTPVHEGAGKELR
jgi:hypothetical protein